MEATLESSRTDMMEQKVLEIVLVRQEFPVIVGLHEGLALSPYLIVINELIANIQQDVP